MEGIRDYLLRLTAAAIFSGIIAALAGNKGTIGKLLKLLTGVFMVIVIVSPLIQIRISSYADYFDNISAEAERFTAQGEKVTEDALADIIKSEVQAYILDKAERFGAVLSVEVSLTDAQIPKPYAVRITGSISPYGRRQLEQIIRDELGVTLEDQTWIG